MKNTKLILIMLLFAITKSYSQDKGYMAISIGPSLPIGNFASKDPDNEKAGLATAGAIFDISFSYKIGKNFGVSALIRGQANGIDKQVLSDELLKDVPSNIVAEIETEYWSAGAGLIGGYGSFPITSKISIDSKLMVGFLSATSPSIDVNLTNGNEFAWVKQESVTSDSFAYLVGIGLKFNVGKRICLLANLDYLGAKPKFENVEVISSNGNIDRTSWSQPFGTINIAIGVGYRL